MKKILFVCPFDNSEAKAFVDCLAQGFKGWNIQISDSGLSSFLFEPQKYDIAHFFLPAQGKAIHRMVRKSSQTQVLQTLISGTEDPNHYKKSIFTNSVIAFSEQEAEKIRQAVPDATVHVILPCTPVFPLDKLEPSGSVRQKYGVEDRLLAVALNDFNDQKHFAMFLYTVREYQRRGGYKFVIPRYSQDRASSTWRKHLQEAITKEKCTSTILLDDSGDIHSLIDAADVMLSIDTRTDRPFGFPLLAVEGLCAGKPLICYNVPPMNELVRAFRKEWVAIEYEDYSRISRDFQKEAPHLEEIGTELARFARTKMSMEAVAEQYKQLYNSL